MANNSIIQAGKLVTISLLGMFSNAYAVENVLLKNASIMQTFDQFVISETAAKHCLLPSQEEFSKFDSNFDVISNFAFQELSQKYPYIQQNKISQTLVLKARALSLSTAHKIQLHGCETPDIQSILKRYQLQASWEPSIGF